MTHCKYGHELTEANLRLSVRLSDGYERRTCRACQKEKNDARRKPDGLALQRAARRKWS